MCLKGLIAAAFDSSEPLLLLRLNGRVGAIPTYRVYRLYDRACSLRLSNIFIATSIFVYYIVPNFTLVELLLMIYCKAVPGAKAMFYKIYMVYRDFITMLIFGVLCFTITPIFTFSRALVRYGNASLRLFCTRFTWFTEILSHC